MKKIIYRSLSLILVMGLLAACSVMPEKPARTSGKEDTSDSSSSDSGRKKGDDSRGQDSSVSGSGSEGDGSQPADPVEADPAYDINTLWTEIQGIWGAADLSVSGLEFDVYDFDEEGKAISYYVWGFEPSSTYYAREISVIGKDQYEVTLENDQGSYQCVFDLSRLGDGELTVTSKTTGAVMNYICWGHNFDEVYAKTGVYG